MLSCAIVLLLFLLWCYIAAYFEPRATNLKSFILGLGTNEIQGKQVIRLKNNASITLDRTFTVPCKIDAMMLISTIYATHFSAQLVVGGVSKVYSMGMLYMSLIMFVPLMWSLCH